MDNVHTKCTMYKVVCRKDANYVVTDWLRVWWLRESNFFSLFGCPGSALQMKAMERSSMTAVLDDLFGILMHRFKWMSCREGNFLLMLCSADFITLCRSPWSPKEQLPYQAVMQPLRMFNGATMWGSTDAAGLFASLCECVWTIWSRWKCGRQGI